MVLGSGSFPLLFAAALTMDTNAEYLLVTLEIAVSCYGACPYRQLLIDSVLGTELMARKAYHQRQNWLIY